MKTQEPIEGGQPESPERRALLVGALCCLATVPAAGRAAQRGGSGEWWPQYRGPQARGVAAGKAPEAWDVPAGRGVAWKTPIPGLGHSSPVIWGDRLFVTTAISGKADAGLKVGLYGDIRPVDDDTPHQWKVYCLNRKSGKVEWERTAHTGVPRVKRHTKATHANCTMAVDRRYAVAFFGSEGLYCYDHQGKLLWKKDLGLLDSGFFLVPTAQWGFASSPVIEGDRVIVQCDVQKGSFLAAFRLRDGEEVWRTPRSDVPTWSTPTVCREGGIAQVVVNGFRQVAGYDLNDGRLRWHLNGNGDIPVPTPIVAHGLIYITASHGRLSPVYAIRPAASGDLSHQPGMAGPHLAWSTHRDGAYMQTPIVVGDHLYVCKDSGILSCFNARTGEKLYQERLGTGRTGYTSSPVAAGDRLYFTSEEGDVSVVAAGPRFEVLGVQPLGEVCLTTPAIVESRLYFRTQGHVVAIGG